MAAVPTADSSHESDAWALMEAASPPERDDEEARRRKRQRTGTAGPSGRQPETENAPALVSPASAGLLGRQGETENALPLVAELPQPVGEALALVPAADALAEERQASHAADEPHGQEEASEPKAGRLGAAAAKAHSTASALLAAAAAKEAAPFATDLRKLASKEIYKDEALTVWLQSAQAHFSLGMEVGDMKVIAAKLPNAELTGKGSRCCVHAFGASQPWTAQLTRSTAVVTTCYLGDAARHSAKSFARLIRQRCQLPVKFKGYRIVKLNVMAQVAFKVHIGGLGAALQRQGDEPEQKWRLITYEEYGPNPYAKLQTIGEAPSTVIVEHTGRIRGIQGYTSAAEATACMKSLVPLLSPFHSWW
eukprot:TRINITY_DN27580_c0_g1_i1.p1 TRINITY_DN27580_c0_g1~~TRINITY_DN27580_c0_g1_i1.p1  ORF type:complete len:365 (+),score=81.15 TRINITY_DN27580_c0_g1_i1:113-1207(+)